MQLISKFSKRIRSLLCIIDLFSKYAWVIPLKAKKGFTSTNAFQKFLDESIRKLLRVDKGSEFDNRSMKPWIEKDRNEQNLKDQNLQVCNFNIKKCVY